MKLSAAIICACVVLTAGCARNEPASNVVATPPDIPTLQPIAVIDLSSHLLEPSGIFYNVKRNSLYIVSDGRPELFEFSLEGVLIGTTMTTGADLEGITMNAAFDTIYVVEETRQLVTSYRMDGSLIRSFPVNVATNTKNALEGIAMDAAGALFVMNEKAPRLVMEYRNGAEVRRMEMTTASDISDIYYEAAADRFWIVSDESKKVFTIDRSGAVISQWLLPFEKGEGITIAKDKMYIVNDGDAKMYIFQKP